MKLENILESQLNDIDRRDAEADVYEDELHQYLKERFKENYVSVYDVIKHFDYDKFDKVYQTVDHDLEEIFVHKKARKSFLDDLINSSPETMKSTIYSYVTTFKDFLDTAEAEDYTEDFKDEKLFKKDPDAFYDAPR